MGDVRSLLVVTGTRQEGELVAGPGVTVLAGGGDEARLAQDLARLAPGACGIISFGTGGGLVAGSRLGEMVIGDGLTGAMSRYCDTRWVQALARALPRARVGMVFADGALLATAAGKSGAAAGGAIIADMESHLAGAAAARHGLPFAILRCVSDLAEAALPPAVAVAMRPDGGLALGAVLRSIVRQPGQLPALIRTGVGFGQAFAGLKAGAHAAGARLGFDQR
jgi:adenosylhomocysteine nucleosidase